MKPMKPMKPMRKYTIVLFGVLLLCVTSAFAAKKPAAASTDKKTPFTDPTKALLVTKSSPVLTLKLKSNPTTGYSWFLVGYDHELIKPLGAQFHPPKQTMPGAPGYTIWRFKVNPRAFVAPQMTTITLKYLRPWVVPMNGRKLTFTVVIQEQEAPPPKKA